MRRSLLILLLWTAVARGGDQDPPAVFGCPIPTPPALTRMTTGVSSAEEALPAPGGPDNSIDIISGGLKVDLNGPSSFNDRLVLQQGGRQFGADSGTYDRNTGEFTASGNVNFLDQVTAVSGSKAIYNSTTGLFSIDDAEYDLFTLPARGSADRIALEAADRLSLTDVTYTTCARGNDDWLMHAGTLEIDRTTGTATARDARLEFQGVPILYTPYLTYPIDNRRKSGLLLPEIGSSQQRGAEYSQPYYFNLAPNYDATLTPHFMSDRGLQAQGEFRYLEGGTSGIATAAFLPSDKVTGEDRTQLVWFNQSQLPEGWRGTVDYTDVSDSSYYEDMTSGLANTSQVVLTRSLTVEHFSETWSTLLQVEDYQMLDQALTPEEEPYRELPRVAINGQWPDVGFGLALGLGSEATYFDRSTGVTGLRVHLQPEVSLPLDLGPLLLEPYVGVDYTSYSLENVATDENESPGGAVPIYSVDLRTLLDRTWGDGGKWLQTIEPRAQYVYVPYTDQGDFPVFDTIQPDFNMVQLFRRNRYVGLDRFGDANKLNLGITTRLIRAADGSQFLTATVGETQYFSSSKVVLPGEEPSQDTASDYIAELGMNLNDKWNMHLGYQWDSDQNVTQVAEARVLYRADDYRIVNLAYRFRRDSVREIDVGGAWPIGDRWNVVARYDYSLLDNQPLERFVGIDYSTCCWGLRLVTVRNLTTRSGESDSAISLQLILKGFGNSSTPAESLLGRGILGDSFDRY